MKVLYYHQYFSTPSGAAGTRSFSLARSLVEAGHHVQMVCLRDARTHTGLTGPFISRQRRGFVDGIEVIEFEIPYSNYAGLLQRSFVFCRYALQSLRFLLNSDADLVFATTTPLTVGIAGIAARWFKGVPFVFEVRDLWPEIPRAMGGIRNPLVLAALSALEWISYHSADACIGLAPGICDGIANKGVSPTSITCIPNGCDLELFYTLNPSYPKRPDLIQGLSKRLSKSSFVAAFTGAHGPCNGLESVVDVAIELQRLGRDDIHIVLIGDGKCKPELERKILNLSLKNCHLLPFMPKHTLARILRESVHVGLMVLSDVPAFYRGTSPNKFFDYLASGLPIINNYPGWIADLISEYNAGIVVEPRNPHAFAQALINLADNHQLTLTAGLNSRSLAEKMFSRSELADQWLNVLLATFNRYKSRRSSGFYKQFNALLNFTRFLRS